MEEYDKPFFEKLKEIMDKVQMKDDETSFVGNCYHSFHEPDNSFGPETYERMGWGCYKSILGKSTSVSNYFKNLNDSVNSLNSCCKNLLFSVTKMDLLFLKILD